MKARESGMPSEDLWAGFFRPQEVLAKLGLTPSCLSAADFGCGYGTFTIPAARVVGGTVYAFDIEPEMVSATQAKARAAGLQNVCVILRDFMAEGTGLPDGSVQYAMLFNILHAEEPLILLNEAWRVLGAGGILAIMHWNYDPSTPRGPSMIIRPRPEQCRTWAQQVGFQPGSSGVVDLPPHHYGLVFRRGKR